MNVLLLLLILFIANVALLFEQCHTGIKCTNIYDLILYVTNKRFIYELITLLHSWMLTTVPKAQVMRYISMLKRAGYITAAVDSLCWMECCWGTVRLDLLPTIKTWAARSFSSFKKTIKRPSNSREHGAVPGILSAFPNWAPVGVYRSFQGIKHRTKTPGVTGETRRSLWGVMDLFVRQLLTERFVYL